MASVAGAPPGLFATEACHHCSKTTAASQSTMQTLVSAAVVDGPPPSQQYETAMYQSYASFEMNEAGHHLDTSTSSMLTIHACQVPQCYLSTVSEQKTSAAMPSTQRGCPLQGYALQHHHRPAESFKFKQHYLVQAKNIAKHHDHCHSLAPLVSLQHVGLLAFPSLEAHWGQVVPEHEAIITP